MDAAQVPAAAARQGHANESLGTGRHSVALLMRAVGHLSLAVRTRKSRLRETVTRDLREPGL
jgi:hypothetical protein